MKDMVDHMALIQTRIRAGVWEGVLTSSSPQPALEARHLEAEVPGLTVTAIPDRVGEWAVRLPIPAALLSEGVQTFLIRDRTSGQTLQHFTIITGASVEDDLRAEIDLLRAELDMLKKAFRRHCVETGA